MTPTSLLAAISVMAALLLPPPAHAGEGHDHDHGGAAPAPTGPALPRFAAVSETFELVGVLDGTRITLYLDRTADNSPVTDAQIELEVAGAKLAVARHEDVYEAVLAAAPLPGVLPVTATVTAGQDMDLLAGELDVHGEAPAATAAHAHAWREVAGWAAAALAALGVLVFAGRRLAAARQRRNGAGA